MKQAKRKVGSCRVENTETKEENCRLDYPALSCNDVSAWTSTVVARERRQGPRNTIVFCNLHCIHLCIVINIYNVDVAVV